MSTNHENPMSEPLVLPPARGPWYSVAGDLHCLRVTGQQTGGAYAVSEVVVHPGFGPPPHVHRREDETFHVLEGELTFTSRGTTVKAGPGTLLHMPRGHEHWYRNESRVVARMLLYITPAGIEEFFATIGKPVARADVPPPMPDAALIELIIAKAADYGIEVRVPKTDV